MSLGPEIKLPELPEKIRPRQKRVSSSQRKRQEAAIRYFWQFMIVVALAFVCATVFSRCQRDDSSVVGVSDP